MATLAPGEGLDISNWNAVTSWPAVKAAGVGFGIAKATEGTSYTDPTFAANWAGMTILGGRGAYHFSHPGKHSAVDEADYFLSVVGPLEPTDRAMLDLEVTDGASYAHAAQWAYDWLTHVGLRTGRKPIFYSYLSFIRSMGDAAKPLTNWPLAIAAYGPTPPPTAPWANYALWQRTSSGRVPGIVGSVDIDQIGPDGLSLFAPATRPGGQGGIVLAKPACGIALTPSGDGYWIVAKDGGVFNYGDAPFFGSLAGTPLQAEVVGIAGTPTGLGYWLVAADGGVFAYGDAGFFGSMGGHALNAPVCGMVGSKSGLGYGLVAADGGIFAFGDLPFHGSPA